MNKKPQKLTIGLNKQDNNKSLIPINLINPNDIFFGVDKFPVCTLPISKLLLAVNSYRPLPTYIMPLWD